MWKLYSCTITSFEVEWILIFAIHNILITIFPCTEGRTIKFLWGGLGKYQKKKFAH